jgi:hypothetical protein
MDCWHDEIDRATTEAEVIRNARDYLWLWSPSELTPVTLGWRELKIESPADIARTNRWLAQTPQLRDLAAYFRHAAARIETLRRSRHLRLVHPVAMPRMSAALQ